MLETTVVPVVRKASPSAFTKQISSPSQFWSTPSPAPSTAFGLTAALRSLQSPLGMAEEAKPASLQLKEALVPVRLLR